MSKVQRPRSKVSPSPHHPVSTSPHRPSKSLGQNFLINEGVVSRIIDELSPTNKETIIEIGPGRGALTSQLLEKAGLVIAIEFDRHLVPLLKETFATRENFRLLAADALAVDFCSLIQPATHARVVANLPYNIATAILQRLIAQRICITEMVLMLQKEVVDRLIALPGSKERGYISVFVEAYCETEKLFDVAPGSFRPAPKVWSSVIRLRLKQQAALAKNENLLWQLVSAGFAQRRKTILNNLRGAPTHLLELIKRHGGASIILCQAEIDLQRRAETLTFDEWLRLVRTLIN
ncbi:MAG: 16S rRNA (adenine(1518)-N(6)/adenine(1519)-N(6))-dimethyltransferase RsmA [Acidobacteriota bacterium]|nr:16S rRNA (adenine(1518)-N(6)/adenine(1519)-N(6))-dimethyltransferase RsmA [Acidobacteriota bacterium]